MQADYINSNQQFENEKLAPNLTLSQDFVNFKTVMSTPRCLGTSTEWITLKRIRSKEDEQSHQCLIIAIPHSVLLDERRFSL